MKDSKKAILFLTILFMMTNHLIFSQNQEIKLWDKVPGAIITKEYKEEFRIDAGGFITGIKTVTEPTIKAFLVKNNNAKNAAVLICPGGAYAVLSHEKEGNKVALWLNSIGISAFVLKYRLPSDLIMVDKTIGPLQDAQQAMRVLRHNAKEYNLDPDKIGVLGFSAGGHLASTLSTHNAAIVYESKSTISTRPDFSILIYPVITMDDAFTHKQSRENLLGKLPSKELIVKYSGDKQVNSNTPSTFLVHATDDKAVVVENSIQYYLALKDHNVPVEMHIYQTGGHGFGLGVLGTNNNWPAACEKWLQSKELTSSTLENK